MEELLKQILEEQRKTNSLLTNFINDMKSAQSKAWAMNEENKKKVFEMMQNSNPKVAEMLKGFMHGN